MSRAKCIMVQGTMSGAGKSLLCAALCRIFAQDGLRAVLFGFDKDQALSEHTAAMPVIIQVLEGKLRVGGEGREVELVPGGVVYLSARLPHTVYAVEPSKMLLQMFDNRG